MVSSTPAVGMPADSTFWLVEESDDDAPSVVDVVDTTTALYAENQRWDELRKVKKASALLRCAARGEQEENGRACVLG